ncbi:hypothetical protein MKY54_05485 [Paenibacillus sp. FSL P2-0121]|uniref:hypothetical protein n=1 Tax=Paenibacillus sp. FSL P2-0121 TaxID=2921626 RepID=UPI0030CE0DC8
MKWEELKPGQSVRIDENHNSGFGGRYGRVVAIGTFIGISERIGALIDIHEPLLLIIEPEALEEVDLESLQPGWEEVDL